MRISLVINGDTREGVYADDSYHDKMGGGTRSLDFLIGGVENKKYFFRGYDLETLLFVDKHEDLEMHDLEVILDVVDDLTIHKHTKYFGDKDYFPDFVGLNILNALVQARGEILVHFDWDMAAYRWDECGVIDQWIKWLMEGKYDYISYQSPWSPYPCHEGPQWGYSWASSRFFICRRDIIDYTEILKCISDADYMYEKYPYAAQYRKCSWLEHAQGIIVGPDRVFYPPIDPNYLIFSWKRYYQGLFYKLSCMTYNQVQAYVLNNCGGMKYPCDVEGVPL